MNNYNYKAFLVRENPLGSSKPEIRRFGIDRKLDFTLLKMKLQEIFPDIYRKRFTITWKDQDNDDIILSNDEELQIAYEVLRANFKFYVTLHSDKPASPSSAKSSFSSEAPPPAASSAPSSTSSASKVKHQGVICDGCDKTVVGFRYKCLQCPDYDLCSNCEAKYHHAKHLMIRMPTPLHLRSHHEKRMFCVINKFMKKASSPDSDEDDKSKECPFKSRRYSSASHSRHFEQTPSWLNTFTTYLNDWTNFPEFPPAGMENDAAKQKKNETESEQTQNKSTDKGSTATPPNSSANDKTLPEEIHVEFLKNIGETISQFLDPLGIDVNVQVKTEKASGTSGATSAENQATNAAGANGAIPKKNGSQASNSGTSTPKSHRDDATPNRKFSNGSAQDDIDIVVKEEGKSLFDGENSKADDWTLLDTDNIPTAPVAPSAEDVSDKITAKEATEDIKSSNGPSLYPRLPNVSDNVWHPNPKIQRAVEAMTQMGFTNEGGWLTQLLVSKNGDISKALDVLQPVRD